MIEKNATYARPREEIEEGIRRRQEKWRQRVRIKAPSGRMEEKKPPPENDRAVSEPEEPMPPTHYTS